jgi:hypothetical protein
MGHLGVERPLSPRAHLLTELSQGLFQEAALRFEPHRGERDFVGGTRLPLPSEFLQLPSAA